MTGAQYLVKRIAELEMVVASLLEEAAAKDARIAEMEKKKPGGRK